MASAVDQVLYLPDLFEEIIWVLAAKSPISVIRARQVSQHFRNAIDSSSRIQRHLFLKPELQQDYWIMDDHERTVTMTTESQPSTESRFRVEQPRVIKEMLFREGLSCNLFPCMFSPCTSPPNMSFTVAIEKIQDYAGCCDMFITQLPVQDIDISYLDDAHFSSSTTRRASESAKSSKRSDITCGKFRPSLQFRKRKFPLIRLRPRLYVYPGFLQDVRAAGGYRVSQRLGYLLTKGSLLTNYNDGGGLLEHILPYLSTQELIRVRLVDNIFYWLTHGLLQVRNVKYHFCEMSRSWKMLPSRLNSEEQVELVEVQVKGEDEAVSFDKRRYMLL